jgi:hypothetical protein
MLAVTQPSVARKYKDVVQGVDIVVILKPMLNYYHSREKRSQ